MNLGALLAILIRQIMIHPFQKKDIETFQLWYSTISEMRTPKTLIISLLGSANFQVYEIQKLTATYLELLAPYLEDIIFIIGGRGEQGSVMHTSVDSCFRLGGKIFIVGIEPVFDLEGKVPPENVFGFQNISLRCYALTQLSHLMIAFPGGLGTLQEIIVPMMHQKLDENPLESLRGPQGIFIPTEHQSPVTDFLSILNNQKFISKSQSANIIPVTLDNFIEKFLSWSQINY